jgi:hypothetical protein
MPFGIPVQYNNERSNIPLEVAEINDLMTGEPLAVEDLVDFHDEILDGIREGTELTAVLSVSATLETIPTAAESGVDLAKQRKEAFKRSVEATIKNLPDDPLEYLVRATLEGLLVDPIGDDILDERIDLRRLRLFASFARDEIALLPVAEVEDAAVYVCHLPEIRDEDRSPKRPEF